MFTPGRPILWTRNIAIPQNPFPSYHFKNLSLANTAKGLALYVPIPKGQKDLHLLEKKEGSKAKYGFDLGLVRSFDHSGKGNSAFQHPVKVIVR